MGQQTLYAYVTTNRPIGEVRQTVKECFRNLGGRMEEVTKNGVNGIHIAQGVNGVNYSFTADFHAYVVTKQMKQDKYEIEVFVRWSASLLTWICVFFGLGTVGLIWIVPILYFFINPTQAYQQALNRVQANL